MIRNCTRRLVACLAWTTLCLATAAGMLAGDGISPPRFSRRVGVALTPNRSTEVEAEIARARELLLVVSGEHWGWANWAEPRLVGPAGELRLTELNWKFASSGYKRPQVNANVAGDPQRINGAPVSYGIGVHDPSLLIYDLPPGYTHFRARAGLDDGGSGPVTFMVYADCPFFDRRNPRLWQRDVHRGLRGDPPAFIQTFGGDRLPGEVIAAEKSGDAAFPASPCLVVQSHAAVNHPAAGMRPCVRVIERFVQRVVWQPPPPLSGSCAPGSARLRGGAVLPFRAARFEGSAVKLLSPEGLQTIALGDLAEIHLPARDPWDAYCDELAVLSPAGTAPLLHVELDDGLAVTASRARLRYLPPQHHDSNPLIWHLGLQPAWSLDMLWLPETKIIARDEYPPERPPLTRLRPTVVGGAPSQSAWPPRRNHNVQGGQLSSGGQRFCWGFGVQAPGELHFELPGFATGFRTRVGLDALAGSGGCAQARVYATAAERRLLWQSPLLIGSAMSIDSELIPWESSDPPERLVLQAFEAHHQRPPGGDPLAVRDLLNWLAPELHLQPAGLQAAVQAQTVRWVPAWESWQIAASGNPAPQLASWWDGGGEESQRFRLAIAAGNRLTLTRQVPSQDLREVRITAALAGPTPEEAAEIEVLLDNTAVYRGPLPHRTADQGLPPAILVPLSQASADHRRTSIVSVVVHAGRHQPLIEWFELKLL